MTSRFIPIFSILVAIGLIVLYIRPTITGPIAVTRDRIASYDAALTAAERFAQKEAELTQARASISPESLARLEAFLPDGVDNVQLILDLDALAARSGMTLSDFDVSGQELSSASSTNIATAPATGLALESSSPVDSVELTMTATGSYNSFRKFLTGIEQSLRPLDVVSLDVEQSDTGVYTYEMTIRLYWLR